MGEGKREAMETGERSTEEEEKVCLRVPDEKRGGRHVSTSPAGYYFDPKHGGCLRTITAWGKGRYIVLGVYGDGERRSPGTFWSAVLVAKGGEKDGRVPFAASFTGKDKEEEGKEMEVSLGVKDRSLRWSDKNVWLPLHVHPRQLAWEGETPPSWDTLRRGRGGRCM